MIMSILLIVINIITMPGIQGLDLLGPESGLQVAEAQLAMLVAAPGPE